VKPLRGRRSSDPSGNSKSRGVAGERHAQWEDREAGDLRWADPVDLSGRLFADPPLPEAWFELLYLVAPNRPSRS